VRALQRIPREVTDMSGYTYLRSEPGLWTVGHYDSAGAWQPESDHGDPAEAAERVHWLNGGCAPRCHAHPRLRAFAEDYKVLRFAHGLTHVEIGEKLGINRTSVERNVSRARLLGLLPPFDRRSLPQYHERARRLNGGK
jgi:hypothetical protein